MLQRNVIVRASRSVTIPVLICSWLGCESDRALAQNLPPAEDYVRPGGDTINVTINDTGGAFIFELSGAYQYCETQGGTFLCRVANQGRTWRAFREPNPAFR